MAEETFYAKAKDAFEKLDVGEKISAFELAERVGATNYQQRRQVSAFLSQQTSKGRVKKQIEKDGRMYYENFAPTAKLSS